MGYCKRYHGGGIGGLRRLVTEFEGPISFDLLKVGKHLRDLGTKQLDWLEFKHFLEWLPPTGDSALFRARHPKSWNWDRNTEMLSYILYALQGANWQRAGGDSNSANQRPELIQRPSEIDSVKESGSDEETFSLETIRGEIERRRANPAQ